MPVPDDESIRGSTRRRLGRSTAVTVLSFTVGLTLALGVVSAVAVSQAAVSVPPSGGALIASASTAPIPLAKTIGTAKAGLTTALTQLENQQYPQAITTLGALRVDLANVHQAGMTPKTPAGVMAVFNLEHQIATSLLPPFNGLTRGDVINALQATLSTTFANRTAMLTAVARLPTDEGPDYDDGLSDTLSLYSAEVTAYTKALGQFQLTAPAKTALTADLAKVKATNAQFNKRFGGGE